MSRTATTSRPAGARRRRGTLLLTASAIGLLLWGATACSGPEATQASDDPVPPAVELRQSELTHYDEAGVPVWILRARSFQYFERADETHAREVEVRFVRHDGSEALIVQADQLIFYHRLGDLLIRGTVRGRDPDGLRFTTDEVRWNAEAHRLMSDSPVRVEREDLLLLGKGFEYRPEEGRLTVKDAQLLLDPRR